MADEVTMKSLTKYMTEMLRRRNMRHKITKTKTNMAQ